MSELYHHGILGQKWGVRRTPQQLGHDEKKKEFRNRVARSSGSKNSKTLREARGRDIDELSNEELKRYNERLQLEENYARLTSGRVKKGKDWVSKTIISGIVIGAVSEVAKAAVSAWLKGKLG